ncbi:MAG TPA: hypothetical protein VKB87_23615 [Myxococcaceae bacterium]|nr:hypothetical protein [Myxococcaceae bacterium]
MAAAQLLKRWGGRRVLHALRMALFARDDQPRGMVARPVAAFVPPCNPTSPKTAPAGDAWLHEPKLDGYRLQVIKE